MTSSPELKSMSDSDIDDGQLLELDSDSDEDLTKDAEEFVTSYCQAFDTNNHREFVELASHDISFDWFGKEVQGRQHLQKFMAANIPATRHMSVSVEPCVPDTMKTGSKRKRDECLLSSPLANTNNMVLVHGKLRFSRPGMLRKMRKEWQWERNFKLQLSYSVESSPDHHSPNGKWKVQQVRYENAGLCKRALFLT